MTLPVPRYSIGDKVYVGYYESADEWYDCESCLGTMEWHVVTPAGEEFDIECPACTHGYMCTGRQSRLIYRPYVRTLTIGSVRIDTADRGGDREPVSYMCEETGVGSGSIYYESDLTDSHETAMTVARLKAAAQQQEMDENASERMTRRPRSVPNATQAGTRRNSARQTSESKNLRRW